MAKTDSEYKLDTFFMNVEALEYQKKVYACFPKTKEKCPVLYMHDGHNLFIPEDSFCGTIWQIEKALNDFYTLSGIKLAVVGIGADSRRFEEYSPWPSEANVGINGGKGDIYLDWLTKELVPFIKEKYPTENRQFMAGSSMGGYISLYAGYKYPQVFDKVGVFSPAFWFNQEQMEKFVRDNFSKDLGVYLDIGKKEASDDLTRDFPKIYLEGAREFHSLLKSLGTEDLCYVEDEEGRHFEGDWAKRFPGFLAWLFRS